MPPPALCPLCREPRPVQHGLFLCQKVLRFSRSIKRSIPHPFSLYQPFADDSINPYPLKHTTFLDFLWIFPVASATQHLPTKRVCAAHRPLCTRTQVGCKVGYKNKNDADFQQISVVFHGGGDGSRTHVRKEFSVGVSGCRRSTTFPPRHAGRQANALVAS